MEDIKVSICCITYNHEKYIGNAIDGFLMQKTNFPIEILIHDDASTDNTTEIIKEYEKDYSNIIKPIYQIENQYSQNIKVSKFNNERAKGKYIAICEGDDQWTDPYKLQKQIDYLENHPECSLVVHAANKVNAANNRIIDNIRPSKVNKVFSIEEIIGAGGGLFATNSMVFRSKYHKTLPEFYYNAPVGDYPLTVFLSLMGEVYYIDEVMSLYRYLVPGSWTSKHLNDMERRIEHSEKVSNMLNEINEYTNYKYEEVIQKKKIQNQFNLLIEQGRIVEAKENNMCYYSSLNIKQRLIINIKQYCPILTDYLRRIRRKINNAKL